MKAVVHIGTEKTGTTSIQEFLHINREELLKSNIGLLKCPGLRNHRKLVTLCMNNKTVDDQIIALNIEKSQARNKWKRNFRKELEKELQRLKGDSIKQVIISSEHFHSRLKTQKEIAMAYSILKPHFNEIEVLVYLKRQDRLATSLYSTYCKGGGIRQSVLNHNINRSSHYFNYYKLLSKWSNSFGENCIKVRIFDTEQFINNDFIQDFCGQSNIPYSNSFKIPKRKNEKLSAEVQKVLAYLNHHFNIIHKKTPEDLKKLKPFLISELQKKYQGKELLPTKHEAFNFYKKFHASNKKLFKKFSVAGSEFSNDFSFYPVENESWDLEPNILAETFELLSKFLSTRIT